MAVYELKIHKRGARPRSEVIRKIRMEKRKERTNMGISNIRCKNDTN